MTNLPSTGDLLYLYLARAYCKSTRLSEARIADLSTGNPYFYARLRGGRGCTIKTYRRAITWFSDNWPDGLEWPPDVSRPAPAPSVKEAA